MIPPDFTVDIYIIISHKTKKNKIFIGNLFGFKKGMVINMIKVSTILDSFGCSIGFITEYPYHLYIDKTEVIGFRRNDNLQITEMGKLTVYMKDGMTYVFDCWADSVYCGQFGINVSDDGTRIYVISDEKGLWCYSYKGEILWKTRYTSAGDVIANANGTITCITGNKIILLDGNGKLITSRKILPYLASKASENMIYAAISERKAVLIDCETLDIIWQLSINQLGLDSVREAIIYKNKLILFGEHQFRLQYVAVDLPSAVIEICRYDESLAQRSGYRGFIQYNGLNLA